MASILCILSMAHVCVKWILESYVNLLKYLCVQIFVIKNCRFFPKFFNCCLSAGFAELPQDDQLILIKSGYFEIWLARMARMCNKVENVITFEDGAMIQKDELAVVYTVSCTENWSQSCIGKNDCCMYCNLKLFMFSQN